MLSALILTGLGYPAVQLAPQPVRQRSVRPGPLVLRTDLLKSPAPTTDRDRTVSRRSEPSSRATLIGEQPNPWDVPSRATGSLCPAFAPGRLVGLSVKQAYANTLNARLPFVLSLPWEASVTLLEATTPVKLPTKRCPHTRVRSQATEGWYFNGGSRRAGALRSSPPTYPTHRWPRNSAKLQ